MGVSKNIQKNGEGARGSYEKQQVQKLKNLNKFRSQTPKQLMLRLRLIEAMKQKGKHRGDALWTIVNFLHAQLHFTMFSKIKNCVGISGVNAKISYNVLSNALLQVTYMKMLSFGQI